MAKASQGVCTVHQPCLCQISYSWKWSQLTGQGDHQGSFPRRQLLCIKRCLANVLHPDGELQARHAIVGPHHRAADPGGLRAELWLVPAQGWGRLRPSPVTLLPVAQLCSLMCLALTR